MAKKFADRVMGASSKIGKSVEKLGKSYTKAGVKAAGKKHKRR